MMRLLGIDINWGDLIEFSFAIILVYLIARNAQGFSSVVRSTSSAYIGAVKALQGR